MVQPDPQRRSSLSDVALGAIRESPGFDPESIDVMLSSIREHLGMEVAFVAEFRGSERIFRHVDASTDNAPIKIGDTLSLEIGYCRRVVEGTLPELIPDTSRVAAALEIPETRTLPIGAHLSVPIRLRDQQLYGTLCCFSAHADPSLNDRDLNLLRLFGDLIGRQIELSRQRSALRDQKIQSIYDAMGADAPSQVYQPVIRLADSALVGIECLSRFHIEPIRPPDQWFRDASEAGLGLEFELHAVRKSLLGLQNPPGDFFIAVNCSAETALSPGLPEALAHLPAHRVVLEITENERVQDYPALLRHLAPLRARGVRIAVDDAGSGYASLRHILAIHPDFIKLDVSLIRNIHLDSDRRALAAALVTFGNRTGSSIIAEGVENSAQVDTLLSLGVECAQGNFLGEPTHLSHLLQGSSPLAASQVQ